MMATVLRERYKARKENMEAEQVAQQGGIVGTPHELEAQIQADGTEIIGCRKCGRYRVGTAQQLSQENCPGRRMRRGRRVYQPP